MSKFGKSRIGPSRLNSLGRMGNESSKVSFGALTSGPIGKNIDGESPEKRRQRENREKLAERLDKLRSGWYNGVRYSDGYDSSSGKGLKMAGRKAAVSGADFIKVYNAGCKAGKTNDEIAADLGMSPASVSSRASALRKEARANGKELPYPKSKERAGRSHETDADFLSALDSLDDLSDEAVDSAE